MGSKEQYGRQILHSADLAALTRESGKMVVRPEGRTPIIRQGIGAMMCATAMLIGSVAINVVLGTFTGATNCVSITGPSGSVGIEFSSNGSCVKSPADEISQEVVNLSRDFRRAIVAMVEIQRGVDVGPRVLEC